MNLANHVAHWARRTPTAVALRFEGKGVTYATLDRCANALAGALIANGIKRGDRVALFLPNIPAFALAYLATLRAGAIAVSINAIFKSEEVKYILDDSGAAVVFTTAELLTHVPRSECPTIKHVVLCEGVIAGETPLEDWLDAGQPIDAAFDMAPDDPAALLYSSGTTGFPKGVTLTHRNIQSNIRVTAECSDIRATDRLAIFLPLFHVFAQNYIMNGGFEVGATIVLMRRFVPDVVLDAIERERITMLVFGPDLSSKNG